MSVVLLLVTAAGNAASEGSKEPPSLASLDLRDLEGRSVDPFALPETKITVFLFTLTDCPISNRYAPEVRRLAELFAPRRVRFWLVYPDPDEPAEAIENHLEQYQYDLAALRDRGHGLVRLTGVSVTPEAAVFVHPKGGGPRLVYRGRIDNRYVDFGNARPRATEHDLERTLAAVLDGKPVPKKTTKAVGCFITALP